MPVVQIPPLCRAKIAQVAARCGCVIVVYPVNRWGIKFLEAGNPTKPFEIKSHTQTNASRGAPGLILAEDLSQAEKEFVKNSDYYICPLSLSPDQALDLFHGQVHYNIDLGTIELKENSTLSIQFITNGDGKIVVCDQHGKAIEVLARQGEYTCPYVCCDADICLVAPRWEQCEKSINTPLRVSMRQDPNSPTRKTQHAWDLDGTEDPKLGNISSHTRSILDNEGMHLFKHNADHDNPFSKKITYPLTAFMPINQTKTRSNIFETFCIDGTTIMIYILHSRRELSQFILLARREFVIHINPNWRQFKSFHKKQQPLPPQVINALRNKIHLENHINKRAPPTPFIRWAALSRHPRRRIHGLMHLSIWLRQHPRAQYWRYWLFPIKIRATAFKKIWLIIFNGEFNQRIKEYQQLSPPIPRILMSSSTPSCTDKTSQKRQQSSPQGRTKPPRPQDTHNNNSSQHSETLPPINRSRQPSKNIRTFQLDGKKMRLFTCPTHDQTEPPACKYRKYKTPF